MFKRVNMFHLKNINFLDTQIIKEERKTAKM